MAGMTAVWPTGQVTVPAARSTVKSSLLKNPPAGWLTGAAGATNSMPWAARSARVPVAEVLGDTHYGATATGTGSASSSRPRTAPSWVVAVVAWPAVRRSESASTMRWSL